MRLVPRIVVALLALALAPQTLAAPPKSDSWAAPQIRSVVAAGLMAPSATAFRADDALTEGELADLLTALGDTPSAPADASATVTLAELDSALVRHLGLAPAARKLRGALAAAGLDPPKRAGTEALARLLGLRTNHSDERLELETSDPVTRAETAYSVARVLGLENGATDGYTVALVKSLVTSFSLPQLNDWQQRILTTAVGFIGYPYVWAGTSEDPQPLLGKGTPGGFDCSGFVWRVYKLEQYPGAAQLSDVLRGRTTYVMSGEVKPALRIPFAGLQPADVIFFGDGGTKSKPSQVGHMGIYLGNGWFINSSSVRGVMIAPLTGWYRDEFAWARRPLAEAGLEAPTAEPPAAASTGTSAGAATGASTGSAG